MKKGICIGALQGETMFEKLDNAARAGFDGVELMVCTDSPICFGTSDDKINETKKYMRDLGLETYSLMNSSCWTYSLTSDDKEESEIAKKQIIQQLELANKLECDTILALPGIVGCDFIPDFKIVDYYEAYNRSVEAVRELAVYAEKYGVNLGLENVHNKFLNSPVEFNDYLDKIGSKYVGCYFDVGNVMIYGYPEHWIRALKDKIKKVHLKDYRVGNHSFVEILEGDVNYPEVMKAFEEIGYDDWLTAEIPPHRYYTNSSAYVTSLSMDIILGRNN